MIKSNILGFILGGIVFGSIGVVALTISSNGVSYDNTNSGLNSTNLQDAVDEIYSKLETCPSRNFTFTNDKFCKLINGEHLTVGSKYMCDLGDSNYRIFYVLKVDGNNVKLIMDRNITDSTESVKVNYDTALNYLKSGGAGYSTVSSWTKIQNVDLPSAQDIIDASLVVNPKNDWNFDVSTASATWFCLGSHVLDQNNDPYCPTSTVQQKISWLFDYTLDCSTRGCNNYGSNYAVGYWTKDKIANNNSKAWIVDCIGSFSNEVISNNEDYGVRPVITVLKSNLFN